MGQFQRICGTGDVKEKSGKCFTIAGKRVALFNRGGGSFAAIDDGCTHMGASLAEGSCAEEMVVCPWHGAMFSLMTGAASGPPARGGVTAYPTRVSGDSVEIEI